MTPKEIAETFSKPAPEHWQQGLAGRMHILAKAYLALESRIQKLEAVAEALKWYASEFAPNTFSIVDDKGNFISDMAGWGERARKALAELEQK